MNDSSRIALFLDFLDGGGAEVAMVNLAQNFVEQGVKVDMVLCRAWGRHMSKLPSEVRIIDLHAPRVLQSIIALVRYLRRERPVALLSALHYNNEVALWAKQLAGVSTRIVVCEQNTLSKHAQGSTKRLTVRLTPFMARCFYPWADGIVAVSKGVAQDLAQITHLPLDRFKVIYNPAVVPELSEKVNEPVDHPWFNPGEPPVILGVGRLAVQKDFPTLIRAFAQVRRIQPARLMILGNGPKEALLELVHELNLEDDVALPGYARNPYAYMAKASVFVLSSLWEGLPLVLVEAMAVGIPVVSTNCESGPAEILDNGRYGALVPVGDHQAMAEAILKILAGEAKPVDPTWLNQFSQKVITQEYLKVLGISDSSTTLTTV